MNSFSVMPFITSQHRITLWNKLKYCRPRRVGFMIRRWQSISSDRVQRTAATSHRRPHYGGFYTSIMEQESGVMVTATDNPQNTDSEKGKVIFYSRLAGYPINRPADDTAKMYAGIVVPARPEEPLNCCQSGCIHCVWDIYREDIEHFQEKRQQAREALQRASKPIPEELGGASVEKDIISQLDPTLQAFIKLEKDLKQKRLARAA